MNLPSPLINPNDVLRRLFVGSVVNGVRFGVLQLMFDNQATVEEPYLNLASRWQVFAERPHHFPDLSAEAPDESSEHELARAVSLRHKEVSAAEVASPWPHLIMTFTDGTVLFMNGKDEQYEPWTAGLAHAPLGQQTEVIACPGGELAFILPAQASSA